MTVEQLQRLVALTDQYALLIDEGEYGSIRGDFDLTQVLKIVLRFLPLIEDGVTPESILPIVVSLLSLFVQDEALLEVLSAMVAVLLEILA